MILDQDHVHFPLRDVEEFVELIGDFPGLHVRTQLQGNLDRHGIGISVDEIQLQLQHLIRGNGQRYAHEGIEGLGFAVASRTDQSGLVLSHQQIHYPRVVAFQVIAPELAGRLYIGFMFHLDALHSRLRSHAIQIFM